MSEAKGYRCIVKINLPPEENYHSGHSLIVQGDTAVEVEHQLARIIEPVGTALEAPSDNARDQAHFVLLRFIEFAQQGAVKATLDTPSGAAVATSDKPVGAGTAASGSGPAAGSAPDLASKAVLKAVAKRTGKSLEELGGLTKAQATEMFRGGVK